MTFPPLKQNIVDALAACGRDRAFHRNDAVGIAIRFDAIKVEPPADARPCDVALLAATVIRLRQDADRLAELLKEVRRG